jgi:hypothetical protein
MGTERKYIPLSAAANTPLLGCQSSRQLAFPPPQAQYPMHMGLDNARMFVSQSPCQPSEKSPNAASCSLTATRTPLSWPSVACLAALNAERTTVDEPRAGHKCGTRQQQGIPLEPKTYVSYNVVTST